MKKMKYSKKRFYKKLMYQKMAEIESAFIFAKCIFNLYKPYLNLSNFKEGTWVLDQGERIVSPKESAELKEFLQQKRMTFKDGTTIEII